MAPNTITLINATEGAGTYNAPPGMILDFDTRSSAYFNDPNGTICSDGCGDINGSGTWSTGNIDIDWQLMKTSGITIVDSL